MTIAPILAALAEELALFAAVGFLVVALNDLAVDIIYFARRLWRALAIYSRYPRAFAQTLPAHSPGWLAVFIPAWDESEVIAPMLRETVKRFGAGDYRLFVGHYANDPATAAAIAKAADPHIIPVALAVHGPTTKADCLNHLHSALLVEERARGQRATAIVLHDAEDVVHPSELKLFAALAPRAAAIQLPVVPLLDRSSPWVAGHYCDEFAESHGKELVVREAVSAAIPLAGVGCAIERGALDRLAEAHGGQPFAIDSMTEDYEVGLRLGALGLKTMFVRIPAAPGDRAAIASRGHFPANLDAAVRQKARWIGGIALSGWDRLGWHGGVGERWMRMRDRSGPLAALLMLTGYLAVLLWAQLALARALGAPIAFDIGPRMALLLKVNFALLLWRMLVRAGFTTAAYGPWQGLLSIPRLLVANIIAILAVRRAIALHDAPGPPRWDKTHHIFPKELGA
ncbi:MAG: glycosyl transferase family protein [Sphingomicrobium sp.]